MCCCHFEVPAIESFCCGDVFGQGAFTNATFIATLLHTFSRCLAMISKRDGLARITESNIPHIRKGKHVLCQPFLLSVKQTLLLLVPRVFAVHYLLFF